MKKFLGNRKVKEQILSFDARSLTGPLRKQVQKIMQVASLPPASVYCDFAPPRVPYVRVYTHVRMVIFLRLCVTVPSYCCLCLPSLTLWLLSLSL